MGSPRNIRTENWRKLSNLTAFLEIFLYLKNNDSVEHVWKVLLIMLFIYFQGKIKFSHCIWFIFWFSFASLLSKMKSLYFSLWKFVKFLMAFLKGQVSFPSHFMRHRSSLNFKLVHFPLWIRWSHQNPNFETFECSGKYLPNSSCDFENSSPFLYKFCTIL